MKRTVISLFCLLVLVSLAAGQNTTVTVGGSVWMCKYDMVATDTDYDDVEIGTGTMFGPYIAINFDRFNIGANYLLGTFDVKDPEIFLGNDFYGATPDVELKRNDVNFTAGYRIIATKSLSMNLFGGVKLLKYTATTSIEGYDVETEMSGPMFGGGASLVIPFGSSNLYAYGSMAYLTGTMNYSTSLDGEELDSGEADEATNLVALTAGMGYRFPGGFGISGGYRADVFGSNEAVYVDRLSGLILSGSYTF